ncbi:hypothetical protein ACFQ05_04440 [Amycolatopsis umgeniensis]|uniref:DUF4817 domain-containing protein n=1 Tax=Amycolatopsis umgeniensis TaxID=336628 RepID=A0A841B1D2_9PSEU|nr:hypothetical protein [Amycolatopsis umgeniensis]MBB5852515.1 hypothetical protein [Amycolatopsis umgeniensis]
MKDSALITMAMSSFNLSNKEASERVSLVTSMFRSGSDTATTRARYSNRFGANRDDTHEFVMFVLLRFEAKGK